MSEGNFSAAQQQYEDAVELFKEKSITPLDVAQTMNGLAVVALRQKNFSGASNFYKLIMEEMKKQPTVSDRSVADCWSDIAACSSQMKDFKSAYASYSKALALYKPICGAKSLQVERTMRRLAEAARGSNKLTEANLLSSEADSIKKAPQPIFVSTEHKAVRLLDITLPRVYELHPRVLDGSLQNQGDEPIWVLLSLTFLDAQGKAIKPPAAITIRHINPNETIKLSSLKRTHRVPEGTVAFKIDSMSVFPATNQASRELEGQERELKDQERKLGESLDKAKNSIKKVAGVVYNANKGTVETLHNCAQSLIIGNKVSDLTRKGNCIDAEKLLEPFKQNPESCPGIGVQYDVIAKCYEDHGDNSGAERCYKAAIQLDTKSITSPLYESALGSFYSRQGKHKEGEKLIRHALQTAQERANKAKQSVPDKTLSEQQHHTEEERLANYPVPDITDQLADCLNRQGKTKESDKVYRQYLLIEPNKSTSLEMLAGDLPWKFHDPVRAISLYKRAIAIRESVFGQESEYTAPDYDYLAYIYTTQGKYPEAEKLYRQSIAGYKKVKNPTKLTNMNTSFALNNYAELLEKLGRTDEAKELKIQAKQKEAQEH